MVPIVLSRGQHVSPFSDSHQVLCQAPVPIWLSISLDLYFIRKTSDIDVPVFPPSYIRLSDAFATDNRPEKRRNYYNYYVVFFDIFVDMSKLSEKAFAIMATCPESRKIYGITVDNAGTNQYVFHWAFPISRDKAHREGFDVTEVHGSITKDPGYPGCPYCGSKEVIFCGNCGGVICYHGQKRVTCPQCGFTGDVAPVESVNLKGGGY